MAASSFIAFAGCTIEAVLSSLGLRVADLFAGPPPSPEQAFAHRAARDARERAELAERQARREAWEMVRRWQAIVNTLGAKLARMPEEGAEGDALAVIFHRACDRLHDAETEAEQLESGR